MALHPDLVLMALSAHDIEVLHGAPGRAPAAPPVASLGARMRGLALRLRSDRAIGVAQHFLYMNLDTYLPLYLGHGDEADFLRAPLSAAWRGRLAAFDSEVRDIVAHTQAAGVPFMLVFVPLRAQALLLRWKQKPSDIDPTLLGQALGDIARRHGARYLDLTETIGDRPEVASLYYPLDSHPDAAAGGIIADAIAHALLASDMAPIACRVPIEAAP